MLEIDTIKTHPFTDQKPGTSGLRKKVKTFQQPHYLANFVQSIVDVLPENQRHKLVVGGDGRYFNDAAIHEILSILVANGVKEIIVGEQGILSTPAVSHLIRSHKADGGIVLSASHNPGGPEHDFGIKFNNNSGAPAPESVTDGIYQSTKTINQYRKAHLPEIDLSAGNVYEFGGSRISVVDSVDDYLELMVKLFDFDRIQSAIKGNNLTLCFDAMSAVTGPYARRVFGEILGIPSENLLNCDALPDFGGGHPDPNRVYAKTLYEFMMSDQGTTLGAASDGDGDRNMILGQGAFVSPSDSLALIAQHHRCIPQFKDGLVGVARSMPTSTALDRVAQHLNVPCYETPTGWKFFGNLLDQGLVRLCGEESFGTSGDHVREKDGVWAVLCWLNILAQKQTSIKELLESHWMEFGRSYYCRHDYDGLEADKAHGILHSLLAQKTSLPGTQFMGKTVNNIDVFSYEDPVDGSLSDNQGIRVGFDDGSRIVYRLSGTGTDSATLRVYLEQIETDRKNMFGDAIVFNDKLGQFANHIASLSEVCDMKEASVKT